MNLIPFGKWYYQMARAQHYLAYDANITDKLHPGSDFDRQELTSWLKELFDCIRKKVCLADIERGFHY